MRITLRRSLAAAVSVCGLVLAGTGTAAADTVHRTPTPTPAPAPAPSSARPGITLRLASADATGAAVNTPPSPLVVLAPLTGARGQSWTLENLGGGRFVFRNDDGSCMKWAGPQHPNTPVLLAKCGHDSREFSWHFVPRADGYQVQTDNGLCLNVQGGAVLGHGLIIYPCTAAGAPNDVWLPVLQES